MPNFDYFALFPIFSLQSGLKLFRTPYFDHLALLHLFPQKWPKIIQNTQFWFVPHFFLSFPTKVVKNDCDLSILLPNLFPPK